MVLSSWPWSLREFTRFSWWMQTERRVASNSKTKPTDLGCESADKWLLNGCHTWTWSSTAHLSSQHQMQHQQRSRKDQSQKPPTGYILSSSTDEPVRGGTWLSLHWHSDALCPLQDFKALYKYCTMGSRPSDHYFRSVCWFVCFSVQSFSQPSLIRFRWNLEICYMFGFSCVP